MRGFVIGLALLTALSGCANDKTSEKTESAKSGSAADETSQKTEKTEPEKKTFSAVIKANEAAAIDGLQTIYVAQTFFKDLDKDGDGKEDYGTLAELLKANLVEKDLGSGERKGYRFACGTVETEELGEVYWATATPISAETGRRHFATNGSDVHYSEAGPVKFDKNKCIDEQSSKPIEQE